MYSSLAVGLKIAEFVRCPIVFDRPERRPSVIYLEGLAQPARRVARVFFDGCGKKVYVEAWLAVQVIEAKVLALVPVQVLVNEQRVARSNGMACQPRDAVQGQGAQGQSNAGCLRQRGGEAAELGWSIAVLIGEHTGYGGKQAAIGPEFAMPDRYGNGADRRLLRFVAGGGRLCAAG